MHGLGGRDMPMAAERSWYWPMARDVARVSTINWLLDFPTVHAHPCCLAVVWQLLVA